MESFLKKMEDIDKMMLESFKSKIKDQMDKKFYLCVFFGTFLGEHLFPMNPEDFELFTTTDVCKYHFSKYCHQVINSINLCEPETNFFCGMMDIADKLDTKENSTYINKCIELYHKTENLPNCQLGPNIMNCLEASLDIIIC